MVARDAVVKLKYASMSFLFNIRLRFKLRYLTLAISKKTYRSISILNIYGFESFNVCLH